MQLIFCNLYLQKRTFLSEAMRKAVQDMTRCTNSKCQQQHSYKSLFAFITSIARTNFEIELVQRGGSLCILPPTTIPLRPKRDCIGKFFLFIIGNK